MDRMDIQTLLKELLDSDQVYFQPPPSINMTYPCIVYHLDTESVKRANNKAYNRQKGYRVTVMDWNPDSEIPDKIGDLPRSRFSRKYTAEKLNHFVYIVFF